MTSTPRWFVRAGLAIASTALAAGATIETVKKSADDWVQLRLETSRLETAWKEERSLVEAMVATLEERATAAEEKRDLVQAKTARDREEMDVLQAKTQTEADDVRALAAGLKALTARLVALRPSLPPRLSDALELSYRSLDNPELPPGDRMQFVMNVLNRCGQFNRTITVGEDVVTLPEESGPVSLPVIYWGLSHGYAVNHRTREAWIGAPASGAWRWERKPDAYDNVVRLIAVAGDRADPSFVAVPAPAARLVNSTSNP